MAHFTTRVEPHNGTYADYNALHRYMADEGYSRVIQGDNGKWYELPPAEYYGAGPATIEAAREAAQRAALKTGRTFGLFVTEGDRRAWLGLSVAQA